ncbi:hypothetical protein [Capillibacterium thermochitinicola]|uniref:Uncharacterized protein n=1 Tax=Capillibacterium thermochitinicola TaxID=2699427 RepID=A0A8J6I3V6_9FIRM|nr:hypothetical protein [Capillibacterium thermochitinicola]MBA2133994.1 hypothetical protein [Capillibacterium thermochitinicola]
MVTKELLYFMMARFYEEGGNFLDSLLPFVEFCLAKNVPEKLSSSILKEVVETEFPFNFPLAVYEEIINRLVEKDVLSSFTISDVIYYEPKKGFKRNDSIAIKRLEYTNSIQSIAQAYIVYLRQFGRDISLSQAKEEILEFVLKNIEKLLLISKGDKTLLDCEFNDVEKIVSSFIINEYENGTENIKYLLTVLKGAICYQFIYYKEAAKDNNLDELVVFFDSSLIIYALGYNNEIREELANEIISQLRKRNAQLYCFEHTVTEIINILSACEKVIRQRKAGYGQGRFTVEYFLSQDNSITRINEAIVNLREDIQNKLGINIYPKSLYESKDLTPFIDEKGLVEYLKSMMRVAEDDTQRVEFDAKSITLTAYLRNGVNPTNLNEAKAIFVTHNRYLAYCSSKYLNETTQIISTTMPYSQLSTLLLLTDAISCPNLPLTIVVENCYAAICPTDLQWEQYINDLNAKYEEKQIGDRDYLRYRSMKIIRFPLTQKIISGSVTALSLEEILKAEEEQKKKEEEKIRSEEKELAQKKIESLEKTNLALEERLRRIRDDIPRVVNIIFIIMRVVFTILTALSTIINTSRWVIKTGLFLLALLAAFVSYFPNKFFGLKDWIIKKELAKFDRKYGIQS